MPPPAKKQKNIGGPSAQVMAAVKRKLDKAAEVSWCSPVANTGKWVPELVELPVEDRETLMRKIEIITATWVYRGANMRSNI